VQNRLERYYHYTSVAGALGIISSRSVWLTDYRYLNDRLEFRQGLEHLLSQISKQQQDSLTRALRWHGASNHHCVFSLSQSPKILSQWRAYASDGAGFALGLDRKALEHAGLSLVKCRYEDHEQYARDLLQKYEAFIKTVHEASQLHTADNVFAIWVENQRSSFCLLMEDLIALKNPAFSEELEIRAVQSRQSGQVKKRVARDLIIPYVEEKIWSDDEKTSNLAVVIPEIWLGPKCNEMNIFSILTMNMGMCMIHRHDCGYR